MIGLVLALGGIALLICFFFMFMGFCVWAMKEHHLARRYRKLVAMYEEMKNDPTSLATGWIVTFKLKGKVQTLVVPAASEALAILEVVKSHHGVGPRDIISSVKA